MDFPLESIHPKALKAHEASICAKDKGKIHDYIFNLACIDVLFFYLFVRPTDVTGAVGSLIVGKLDYGHLGKFFPLKRVITDVDDGLLEFRGGLGLGRSLCL